MKNEVFHQFLWMVYRDCFLDYLVCPKSSELLHDEGLVGIGIWNLYIIPVCF